MWGRVVGCILVAALLWQAGGALPQAAKVYRIGWLSNGSQLSAPGSPASGVNRSVADFEQGLRDAGYVEGRNLAIEYKYAAGNQQRLPELAAELVRLKVDVIVTSGEPAALAAKRTTSVIPIVATEFGTEPVKAGLVTSLGRPEGNITGLATLSDELWQKRLGLLKEIAPKVSRIWVLWNPANPGNAGCVEEIKAAAGALQLEVLLLEVRDASALERAFAMMGTPATQRPNAMPSKSAKAAAGSGKAVKAGSPPDSDPTDALTACWDSALLELARSISDFALERRLVTVAPLKEYVDEGFLMSLGTSLPSHRRRAAYYVNKILKGTKPAELPVEQATLFELVINLKTAKALGLTPPPQMVANADDVIR